MPFSHVCTRGCRLPVSVLGCDDQSCKTGEVRAQLGGARGSGYRVDTGSSSASSLTVCGLWQATQPLCLWDSDTACFTGKLGGLSDMCRVFLTLGSRVLCLRDIHPFIYDKNIFQGLLCVGPQYIQ